MISSGQALRFASASRCFILVDRPSAQPHKLRLHFSVHDYFTFSNSGSFLRIAATVENGNYVDDRFGNEVINRKRKATNEFAVKPKRLFMYPRICLERFQVVKNTIEEIITDAHSTRPTGQKQNCANCRQHEA